MFLFFNSKNVQTNLNQKIILVNELYIRVILPLKPNVTYMSHFRYVTLGGVTCQKCVLGGLFSLNDVPLNFPKSRNGFGFLYY